MIAGRGFIFPLVVTGPLAVEGDLDVTGEITATENVLGARFLAEADSVGAPGHSWQGDLDTGLWLEGTNIVATAAGGVRHLRASATGVNVLNAPLSYGQYLVGAALQTTNLTALTHDLSLGAVDLLVLTSTGAQTLTSITGGVVGRDLLVINANAADVITLQDDNGADGTAANRFIGAGGLDVPIAAGGSARCSYRTAGGVSRWFITLP